jgi:hypothetical protein
MKRVGESAFYAWVGAALGLGVAAGAGGCGSDGGLLPGKAESKPAVKADAAKANAKSADAKPADAKPADDAAKTAAALANVQYQEIPVGERLVVVGTKEGAERARANGKPASFVTEIGYGEGGKTVYFENKPEGMEKLLKAEYAKRHPGAGK